MVDAKGNFGRGQIGWFGLRVSAAQSDSDAAAIEERKIFVGAGQFQAQPVAIELDRAIQIGHGQNHDGHLHLPEGHRGEEGKRCKFREQHAAILCRYGEKIFSNLAKFV